MPGVTHWCLGQLINRAYFVFDTNQRPGDLVYIFLSQTFVSASCLPPQNKMTKLCGHHSVLFSLLWIFLEMIYTET
ncbi:hypothetical protein DKX15_16640 [Enterococcus faecium]|nr:hypothetical protein DKX15_16640 [Enterococcus faecium]